jgi:methionyl aminopeptidase
MINLKSKEEINLMRHAGAIVRDTLLYLEEKICPGMTTKRLDALAYEFIRRCGAQPSFLGYNGFPSSICVSIDDEVVHGIPSARRVIEEGQIVSVDVGAYIHGFHGDAARTFAIGRVSEEKLQLIKTCEECFFKGVERVAPGSRLGDVSNAIQTHAEAAGYSVVREMIGHGIGKNLHEDPDVPNYGPAGRGVRLSEGMALAIEPMINLGTHKIMVLENEWTTVTVDGRPSAHYENTVVVTENGCEILTK